MAHLHEGARSRVLDLLLKYNAKVYVLAGAVRDSIATNGALSSVGGPRDFDLAVSNVNRSFFDEVLSTYGTRNRHGGYVLKDGRLPPWDVWRLEDTIGLRKTGTECSVENVLRSFNLNCNAIAFDLAGGVFLDAGAMQAVRGNTLGFVRHAIRHSRATFAAKALLSQLRFGCRVDAPVQRFIARHLDQKTLIYEASKVFPGVAILGGPEGGERRACRPRTAARGASSKVAGQFFR